MFLCFLCIYVHVCVCACACVYVCVWRQLNRPLLGSLCFYIIHHPSVQDTHIHTGMLTKEGRRGMTTVKSDRRGDRRAVPADQLGDGRPANTHTDGRTEDSDLTPTCRRPAARRKG